MSDLDQTLKAGTLLVIETGEYSDRWWDGPVRVVKAFRKQDAVDAFRAAFVPYKNDDYQYVTEPEPSAFLPWLIANGYVEHVDGVHSWHVGSAGEFEP